MPVPYRSPLSPVPPSRREKLIKLLARVKDPRVLAGLAGVMVLADVVILLAGGNPLFLDIVIDLATGGAAPGQ